MKGFSLIELLVVLTILMFLSSLAVPMAEITMVRTRERELRDGLRETRQAIDRFRNERKLNTGCPYPGSIGALLEPIPTGALRPAGNPGPFLANIPRHSLLGGDALFVWEVRSCQKTDTWQLIQDISTTPFTPDGIFDIRVPVAKIGAGKVAMDSSFYEDW